MNALHAVQIGPEAARQKPARLVWDDPFLLENQLSEEERMIRDAAHAYCQDGLLRRVQDGNRHEIFDHDITSEMGELDLLGATIPEEYGGVGANYVSYGLVAREVESVDSGYRSAMSVQSSLVMHPIFAYGADAQRAKYLPKLASGDWVGCFGLTEPDAGSGPAGMLTRAKPVDGGYTLSGAKNWITNSPIADFFIIWTKANELPLREEATKCVVSTNGLDGEESRLMDSCKPENFVPLTHGVDKELKNQTQLMKRRGNFMGPNIQ